MKKIVLFTVLFSSCVFAKLDTQNASKVIVVSTNKPTFVVKVPSNPTTGFSWYLGHYDANLITPISHKYLPPTKIIPGAGGSDQWTFRINKPGFKVPHIISIKLLYARTWNLQESESTIIKVFTHDS